MPRFFPSTTDARRTAAGAALLVAAVLLLGCGADEPPPAAAAEPAPEPDAAASADPNPPANGDAAPPAAEETAPAAALLAPRGARVLPHDYAIGPLQDLLTAGDEEEAHAVTTALLPFLRALAEGRVAPAAVAPDRLRSLQRSLQFHLDAGAAPHAARIGAVTIADGEAAAAVRLFGDPGRVAGEIYLAAADGRWQVVDVQLDLPRLALPYSPREPEFVPRSDRWLLLP